MRLHLLLLLPLALAGCAPVTVLLPPGTGVSAQAGPAPAGGAVSLTWTSRIIEFSREPGRQFVFACPPGGQAGRVTGTDVYGETSSVCTAAVHAGLITLAGGGRVTAVVRPGSDTFSGSSRNGITSVSYGRMTNSFVFAR